MKKLKFVPHLAGMILKGEKTCTWRFFDDKDIQTGDKMEFYNSETGAKFGEAIIELVTEKKFKDINEEDMHGHEPFKDKSDMFTTYKKYYGEGVQWESNLKVIRFSFNPNI